MRLVFISSVTESTPLRTISVSTGSAARARAEGFDFMVSPGGTARGASPGGADRADVSRGKLYQGPSARYALRDEALRNARMRAARRLPRRRGQPGLGQRYRRGPGRRPDRARLARRLHGG